MDQGQLVRVLLSLIVVVGMILAAAWAARRGGLLRQSQTRRIRILDSQRLGARAPLALVQVDDREILIGVTPQQISLLHAGAAPRDDDDFRSHLDQARSS
ncbi:flagellar biosynthetic protein FliO [Alcaligenes sp. Marseille-Q7550]